MNDDISAEEDAGEGMEAAEEKMVPGAQEWNGKIRSGSGGHETMVLSTIRFPDSNPATSREVRAGPKVVTL